MAQVSKQDTLSIGTNVLFTTPLNKSYAVGLLMFNNTLAAYDVEVQRYDASEGNTVSLCTLNLAIGDTVFDTTPYPLNQLDQLIVVSSTASTTYLATFIELSYQVW